MIEQESDISVSSPYVNESPDNPEIKVLNKKSWESYKKRNKFSQLMRDTPLLASFPLTPFCCDNCGYTEFYVTNFEPD